MKRLFLHACGPGFLAHPAIAQACAKRQITVKPHANQRNATHMHTYTQAHHGRQALRQGKPGSLACFFLAHLALS